MFWAELVSDSIGEQLVNVLSTGVFNMNSYMVYIAVALGTFSGLSTKHDRSIVHVWEYNEQLPLKQSQIHLRRVQDAFFGHFMCLYDKERPNKWVFDEAWNKVNEYGCMFVQFPNFTYLLVGCFKGEPYTLPRYPSDRII